MAHINAFDVFSSVNRGLEHERQITLLIYANIQSNDHLYMHKSSFSYRIEESNRSIPTMYAFSLKLPTT